MNTYFIERSGFPSFNARTMAALAVNSVMALHIDGVFVGYFKVDTVDGSDPNWITGISPVLTGGLSPALVFVV